jgi:rare lipoprotein A
MRHLTGAWRAAAIGGAAAALAACASTQPGPQANVGKGVPGGAPGGKTGQPYQVNGRWYTPRLQPDYDEVGTASWYGDAFQLRPTANGEIFDMNIVSAAHKTLPLPCIVEITNQDNGRKLMVRVNDRGPFVDDRIIDVSREAARQLGFDRRGLAHVRVRYVGPAPLLGPSAGVRVASARRTAPVAAPIELAAASSALAATSGQPSSPQIVSNQPIPNPPEPTRDGADVILASAPAPVSVGDLDILPSMPAKSPTLAASAPAAGAAGAYRIQAGAFSAQANAQRAVSRLSGVGQAIIEPTQRGGVTLYRVVLIGPADELQAYSLRERVAQAGFQDARVVRPF